jgi:hypothetical protein
MKINYCLKLFKKKFPSISCGNTSPVFGSTGEKLALPREREAQPM